MAQVTGMRRIIFLSIVLIVGSFSGFAQLKPDTRVALVQGKPIHYEVRGGYAIEQGDIIIGTAEEVELAGINGQMLPSQRYSRDSVARKPTATAGLWPNATLIYDIDPLLTNPQRVLDAADYWNTHTPLKIVRRTTENDYVNVSPAKAGAGCSSHVGKAGGAQVLSVSSGCSSASIIHEFGHAFGLEHEQSRSDRNGSLTVLYDSIDKRYRYNFDQSINGFADSGYYDFDSIMHYPAAGFTRSGLESIETVPVGIPIGQRSGLSPGDIDGVVRLYGIFPTTTTVTTAPVGLTMTIDGAQAISPQTFNWDPGSVHTVQVDSVQGSDPRHVFVAWTDGGDVAHAFAASADRTVVCANFQRQHRVSAIVLSGKGTVRITPASPDGYYPERFPIKLEAIPDDGYQFLNWAGYDFLLNDYGTSASPVTTEVIGANTKYRAVFATGPMTTVDSQPSGRLVYVDDFSYITPARFSWTSGSAHTLDYDQLVSTEGDDTVRFTFLNWDDGSSASPRNVVAGDAAATYSAAYSTEYLLSSSSTSGGSIEFDPPSADGFYPAGSSVQVAAKPDSGHQLGYWIGDLLGPSAVQTVNMTEQREVTGVFATSALPLLVLSSASNGAAPVFDNTGFSVAPGELISMYGAALGPASASLGTIDGNQQVTTLLSGTRVLVNSTPAPLLYAGPSQINAIIPASTEGSSSTSIQIEKNGAIVNSIKIGTTATKPALFTSNGTGTGQVAALNQDGSVNSPANPAPRGSVLVLYGTGAGALTAVVPDGKISTSLIGPKGPVFARVGKLPARLLYVGSAPGLVNGIVQINLVLPDELIGGDAVPLQVIVGTYASPPGTTIAVR